jgi:hypothetical protein
MTTNVMERTTEQFADSAKKATEVLKEGIGTTKRMVKQGGEVVEEMYQNSTRQIRRHPAGTVVITFFVAFGAGLLVGWLMKRK